MIRTLLALLLLAGAFAPPKVSTPELFQSWIGSYTAQLNRK